MIDFGPSLYFVLGSHRSGTSIITRIVQLLGADLGPESDLIGPRESNPSGHWENRPMVLLNDELLRRNGGSWDDPPALAEGWEENPELEPLRSRAGDLIGTSFSGELRCFKDPRSSLLLPFWRTVTPVDGSVLALRDPRNVAASLRGRNNLELETGAWLWLVYTVSALFNADRLTIVRYEDLMTNPTRTARQLAAFLGLPEPDRESIERIGVEVRPSPRAEDEADGTGPLMEIATAVHGTLAARARLARPALEVTADGWLADRISTLEREVADRDRELERRDAELEDIWRREASWARAAREIERSRTWRAGNLIARALRLLTLRRPEPSRGPIELASRIESGDRDPD